VRSAPASSRSGSEFCSQFSFSLIDDVQSLVRAESSPAKPPRSGLGLTPREPAISFDSKEKYSRKSRTKVPILLVVSQRAVRLNQLATTTGTIADIH
jgi:hypothetical protein